MISIYDSILFHSTHLCSRYLLFILSQVLFLRFFALENVLENNNKLSPILFRPHLKGKKRSTEGLNAF